LGLVIVGNVVVGEVEVEVGGGDCNVGCREGDETGIVVVAVEEEEDCGLLSSVGREWEVPRFHVLQLALPLSWEWQ
jgi:hypothetical protein